MDMTTSERNARMKAMMADEGHAKLCADGLQAMDYYLTLDGFPYRKFVGQNSDVYFVQDPTLRKRFAEFAAKQTTGHDAIVVPDEVSA